MAKTEQLVEIKKGKTGNGLLIENDGYIIMNDDTKKIITEAVGDLSDDEHWHIPRRVIMPALLQRFGAVNANNRIYPEDILKKEVERYQTVIAERRALAELNHPESSNIDLGRVAINVVDCHWEGCNLVGHIEFNTSHAFRTQGIVCTRGDEALNLILNGYKIGLSSRGVGDVQERLGKYFVSDYQIICFDVVAEPSTKNAWICNTEDEVNTYLESKKQVRPLIEQNSKIDSILQILNS